MAKNILFIMCDQLRYDYLSCYGHKTLQTPNIDRLAAQGVRFTKAQVQSPICGPSRMSYYTGRYMGSHGANWNGTPLRVGERTLGDYLRPLGVTTALCGKTHMTADTEGMEWLGIEPETEIGARVAECGFDVWDRLDGVHPNGGRMPSHYNDYLRSRGYACENPWQDYANSAEDADGALLSGWLMENARRPARVRNDDAETPYTTSRGIEFIRAHADQAWCLHLSYIKPHWPYIAPEPYASLYGAGDIQDPIRSDAERQGSNPLLAAFRGMRASESFARDEVREAVIPAYMGLIKQIDDNLGRVYQALEETGQAGNTLIVFTSDHGDYLGDHWMGEKEFFHKQSVQVPLLIYDPAEAADATRGTVCDALVEAIDLVPTFIDYQGGTPPGHILEGHSLLPILHGHTDAVPRTVVISEYDFSYVRVRETLGLPIADSRAFMVFDGRYKAVFVRSNLPPVLFDLETDPDELVDIGDQDTSQPVLQRLRAALLNWALRPHARTTKSEAEIERDMGTELFVGVKIGFWCEEEVDAGLTREWEASRRKYLD